VVFVEDTGSGIAPEILPRIWEPFFTTKAPGAGSGLGLATVRNIVEKSGGFITVDTTLGRGTVFQMYLPASDGALVTPEPNSAATVGRGAGECVLVVDDEPGVREVAKAVLSNGGYRVVVAAHGAEALTVIKTGAVRVDVVLTDLDMPELNGLQLASKLASLRPELPVIAMSGLASRQDGFDPAQFSGGFLHKPFTVDRLVGAVRKTLRVPQGQGEAASRVIE
jgi:CheY-like chemotaxis protein